MMVNWIIENLTRDLLGYDAIGLDERAKLAGGRDF
jgi:hypothetical protein